MKNAITLTLFILGIITELTAQIPDRYRSEVFPNIKVTSNVKFSTGVPEVQHAPYWLDWLTGGIPINVKEYNTLPIDLYMDVYEPDGDTEDLRPLVIICFGGGFVQGSRDYWSMVLLAEGFARMGYVAASIDYRLGMNLFDKDIGARSVYRAVQDSRSAIRYFKSDRSGVNTFKIDTSNIFIGGHSAGAFVALHNLYMDDEEAGERPCSTYDWDQDGIDIPDLGCLDCVGGNQGFSGHANGIFSLAGALGFLNLIDLPSDAPPIMFHSQDDGTVPYDTGLPFQDQFGINLINPDLPTVFGSYRTALRSDTVSLSYDFHSYTNRGHGVHQEIEPTKLYDDILPSIGEWFYQKHLKPSPGEFTGKEVICEDKLIQSYTFEKSGLQYYDWDIIGGSFSDVSGTSNQVEVVWDNNALMQKLIVLPYAKNGSQGDIQEFEIEISSGGNNIWMGSDSGDWDNGLKWSKGHFPIECETLVIPEEAVPTQIIFPSNTHIQCNGLQIGQNVTLTIPESSMILTKSN